MKKFLIALAILAGMIVLAVVAATLAVPWMDRYGAMDAEIAAAFPGDELVPATASITNRAVTIHARPEEIYPWLLQLGADKAGLYSYTTLETLANCPQTNADRVHAEWQDLQAGDEVKLCPDKFGPPPYLVAQVLPGQALVLGHQDAEGRWAETWQFVLLPQSDGATRLVTRTRTTMSGGVWSVIHPAVFIMERGMLLGIKERAESAGGAG